MASVVGVQVVQVVDDPGASRHLGMVWSCRNQLGAGLVGHEVVTLVPETLGQFAAYEHHSLVRSPSLVGGEQVHVHSELPMSGRPCGA